MFLRMVGVVADWIQVEIKIIGKKNNINRNGDCSDTHTHRHITSFTILGPRNGKVEKKYFLA